MSAEAAVASALPAVANAVQVDRQRRAMRFAVGTTLASAIAFIVGFDLPFLVPILVAVLLGSPLPRPSLKATWTFVFEVFLAASLGVLITRLFIDYPLMFLLIEFLVLFRAYYALWSGTSPLFVVWMIIAAALIPLLGFTSLALSVGIAKGLVVGAAIAMFTVWLAHDLFPDPPPDAAAAPAAQAPKQLPPPEFRAQKALLSTAVVFPLLVLIYSLNMTGGALVLVFTALLSLQPSFAAGWKTGRGMIEGNVIGGITAIVIYQLLVALPTFGFFILLLFLAGLVFGRVIYSDSPWAPLFKTGFNTVVLLVGMSVAVDSVEAGSKFYERIVQVMLAVFYVTAAFGLIERVSRPRVEAS